jgi:hypothetical protein
MAPVSRHASIGDNLTRWFLYGVLLSLLPLMVHFILIYLHAPRAPGVRHTLVSVVANGELLLIGCCIGASALGERIGKSSALPLIETIGATLCFACIIASVVIYAVIVAGAVGRRSIIPKVSVGAFGCTTLTSAGLMWVTFYSRQKRGD